MGGGAGVLSTFGRCSSEETTMLKHVAFWAFVFLPFSTGLVFHIGETERKCFIEEIPDETMVTGNYKVQLYDPRTNGFAPSSPEIGMHVEIRDPDDKIILSKVYSSEGKFTFTSHMPGEHVICLYSNSTKWFSGTQLRVHLDIQVGEHAIDYANVAQKEKLSELQLRVGQLKDKVEQIIKEQKYQRSVKYAPDCICSHKGEIPFCTIAIAILGVLFVAEAIFFVYRKRRAANQGEPVPTEA